jgi:hypothetical protein
MKEIKVIFSKKTQTAYDKAVKEQFEKLFKTLGLC